MKTKVHFIGALEGDQENYRHIIQTIKQLGYYVITDHSANKSMGEVYHEDDEDTTLYVQNMQQWIRESDIVVVDVTYPGFGSGLEIGIALQYGKQVIVIFQPNPASPAHTVLKGIRLDRFQVLSYNKDTLKRTLEIALAYASEQTDTRFTMVVPSEINKHLEKLGEKGINRSEYIRKLIKSDMEKKI